MSLITIAAILLVFAQFTPQGQEFLSRDSGAATFCGVAILAILSMLPAALMGDPLSVALIAMWGYFSWPRIDAAKRFAMSAIRRLLDAAKR